MADIAFFVGALFPTLIVSRVLLLVMKKWDGGIKRIFFANSMSLVCCTLLGAMGMADGGAFAAVQAFSS